MSQVMSSPLLLGSPTVSLAPCEEPRRALHPAPSPSLPPQRCPYYTTEGWRAQALMAPMPCKGPGSQPATGWSQCQLPPAGPRGAGLRGSGGTLTPTLTSHWKASTDDSGVGPHLPAAPSGPGGPRPSPPRALP